MGLPEIVWLAAPLMLLGAVIAMNWATRKRLEELEKKSDGE